MALEYICQWMQGTLRRYQNNPDCNFGSFGWNLRAVIISVNTFSLCVVTSRTDFVMSFFFLFQVCVRIANIDFQNSCFYSNRKPPLPHCVRNVYLICHSHFDTNADIDNEYYNICLFRWQELFHSSSRYILEMNILNSSIQHNTKIADNEAVLDCRFESDCEGKLCKSHTNPRNGRNRGLPQQNHPNCFPMIWMAWLRPRAG